MPKETSVQPLIRAYAHGVTLRLGMINIVGSLYPLASSEKDVKSSFVSPEHNPVSRVWKDDVTGAIYEEADLSRGLATAEGTTKVVDADALKALRQSPLVKNLMDVSIHPTADITAATFPSAHSAYIFTPDPAAAKAAGFIARTLADHDDLAVMGVCNLRNYEGLYRIVLWRNQLVFQRYMFASDVNPHPMATLPPASKETELFRQVMLKLSKPFEAETYHNDAIKRVRDAVAVLETTGALTPVKRPEAEEDVMSALESYLDSLS
jgi:non-homologous end joining protein Ku